MEQRIVKPILQALLVADHVYEDKRTSKKVVVGIFSSLLMVKNATEEHRGGDSGPDAAVEQKKKPLSSIEQAGSPYVYVNLTDLKGTAELKLRYVSLESHQAIFETSAFQVSASSPLENVEVVMPLPMLPRLPGVYALELLAGEEPLGSYRITVQEAKQSG
jgi:hypothetical protein